VLFKKNKEFDVTKRVGHWSVSAVSPYTRIKPRISGPYPHPMGNRLPSLGKEILVVVVSETDMNVCCMSRYYPICFYIQYYCTFYKQNRGY
jgi:hypothetical protein